MLSKHEMSLNFVKSEWNGSNLLSVGMGSPAWNSPPQGIQERNAMVPTRASFYDFFLHLHFKFILLYRSNKCRHLFSLTSTTNPLISNYLLTTAISQHSLTSPDFPGQWEPWLYSAVNLKINQNSILTWYRLPCFHFSWGQATKPMQNC